MISDLQYMGFGIEVESTIYLLAYGAPSSRSARVEPSRLSCAELNSGHVDLVTDLDSLLNSGFQILHLQDINLQDINPRCRNFLKLVIS